MPNVSVLGAARLYNCPAAPLDQMRNTVTGAVAGASANFSIHMEPAMVLFSNTFDKVPNWQTRSVGAQDITVIAVPAGTAAGMTGTSLMEVILNRIARLEAKDAEKDVQIAELQADMTRMVAFRLRNAVSQVLLHACGQQQFRETECDFFTEMGADHPGVQTLAQKMGVNADKVVKHADAVITRRNAAVHPCPMEALDAEVAEVRESITPALRQRCKWECLFIDAYEHIKEAFSLSA